MNLILKEVGGSYLTKKAVWYFIENTTYDAATNMAIDECLVNWLSEDKIYPTLRFYTWKGPSLSVGHFQDVHQSIDLKALKKHNVELVRRLTGGSAVLHDDELTYSLVVKESDPKIPHSVTEAYYILSQGILKAYHLLGIKASFAEEAKAKQTRSAVCFEQPASYEMLVNGLKISGNAQTRRKGILLQHGSIPLSFNKNLFDLFKFPSEAVKKKKQQAFLTKATSINAVSQQKKTIEDLEASFLEGFETELGVTFKAFKFSQAQWEEINQLADEKYRNQKWTLNIN